MGGDNRAVAVGALNADHALTAAAVAREVLELAALSVAVRRRDEERLRIIDGVERDYEIVAQKPYAANTGSRTAHATHVGRREAHRAAVPREHYYIVVWLNEADIPQRIALFDVDRADTRLVDVLELAEKSLLYGTLYCREEYVDITLERSDRKKIQNLLALLEIEKIDERTAEARARRFRNLVRVLKEESARIREEHKRVVGLSDEDEADEILLLDLSALDTVTAALLLAIFRKRNALNVTAIGKCNYARRVGNEILHGNLVLVGDELGAASRVLLRAVAVLYIGEIFADDGVNLLGIGENRLVFGDRLKKLSEFRLELFALETDELIKTHFENRVYLKVAEAEALLQSLLRLLTRLRGADDGDDFVEIVDRQEKPVENVLTSLGLLEFKTRSARNDLEAVINVAAEEVLEIENLRASAVDGEHDRTESRLELRMLVKMIENDLAHRVAFDVDDDSDVGLRFVADVADTEDDLLLDELGHMLDHFGLVYAVGNLGYDDALAAVLLLLDLGGAADRKLTAAELVHGVDAVYAADLGACREVGALDELHEIVDSAFVAVLNVVIDTVAKFPEIMRRDVGRHADGDTGRAVQKEVREFRGQNGGLFERFVEVGRHIDRILLQIAEKFFGNLLHSHLGVTHRGRAVAVDRAEVAVAVDERNSERERLGHADDRFVNRAVAVGVVLADDVADDTGRLQMLRVPRVAELVHRVETAAMNGLKTVSHVGQGAPDDNAHGVIDVISGHRLFDVDFIIRRYGILNLSGHFGI